MTESFFTIKCLSYPTRRHVENVALLFDHGIASGVVALIPQGSLHNCRLLLRSFSFSITISDRMLVLPGAGS